MTQDEVTTGSSASRKSDEVLAVAEFDERLPTYFLIQALFMMSMSCVLIPLVPFWLFLGIPFHRKQYEALSCVLTARSLKVKSGVLVRTQKSVPLDKITDLALNEGPILRRFGLCSLTIETAGGGQSGTTGQASLVGVKAAEVFRDRVIAQRDAIVFGDDGGASVSPRQGGPGVVGTASDTAAVAVLEEIRDSLQRIERMMEERRG